MGIDVLLITAGALQIVGYLRYFQSILKHQITPNRWSWLIWAVTITLETITYNAITEDIYKSVIFFISAGSCIAVASLLWARARWQKPNATEIFCIIASVVVMFIWFKYDSALWAHILMTMLVPVAFLPTYIDTWKEYSREDVYAWILWTIGDILALIIILYRLDHLREIPYAIIETLCHGVVWAMIMIRRYHHHRKLL